MHSNVFIPEVFRDRVLGHVYGVCLDLPRSYRVPLLLVIQGPSGYGKSFQTRVVLDGADIPYAEVDGSSLMGHYEGDSILELKRAYLNLAQIGKVGAIIIDDFDRSIANQSDRIERTSNSDILTSFLMHLCDNPYSVQGEAAKPVPIILTGNDFGDIYHPLMRHGRADVFDWDPDNKHLFAVVQSIFCDMRIPGCELERFVSHYRDRSFAFFQQVKSFLISSAIGLVLRTTGPWGNNRDVLRDCFRTSVVDHVRGLTYRDILAAAEKVDSHIKDYTEESR
jgi:hypothetical protein